MCGPLNCTNKNMQDKPFKEKETFRKYFLSNVVQHPQQHSLIREVRTLILVTAVLSWGKKSESILSTQRSPISERALPFHIFQASPVCSSGYSSIKIKTGVKNLPNDNDKKSQNTRVEVLPVPLCPPKLSHKLARDRTWTCAAKEWWTTKMNVNYI